MEDDEEFTQLPEYAKLEEELRTLKDSLKGKQLMNQKLVEQLKEYQRHRKELQNRLINLKGNIRVFCRIRPIEPSRTNDLCIFTNDLAHPRLQDNQIAVKDTTGMDDKIYDFDRVFSQSSKQEEVFEDLQALVTSTLDGNNVCVFAYGQTASGKTYTMEGTKDDPGMIPRTITALCKDREERNNGIDGVNYKIEMSVLQIYDKRIDDLIVKKPDFATSKGLGKVLQGPQGQYVQGLSKVAVQSYESISKIWDAAKENRKEGKTGKNSTSSRSHLVLTLYVTVTRDGLQKTSKLHMVDLAGSEAPKLGDKEKGGGQNTLYLEGVAINLSLGVLGRVLRAAVIHKQPPYNEHPLTQLLKDSFGDQDSKTLMIVHVSPLSSDIRSSSAALELSKIAKEVGGR